MPKGKGYTPSELQTLRDEGILSPAEIENIERELSDSNIRFNV